MLKKIGYQPGCALVPGLFFLLLIFLLAPAPAPAATIIRFSLGEKDIERNQYKIELFKLILEHTDLNYDLFYYFSRERGESREEQLEKLERGIITVKSLGASPELEKRLIPIRIPIFKGLIGYRVFLINRNDQHKFDHISSLADLSQLTGVQGRGWIDIKILEAAGLPQIAVSGNAPYRMLNRGGRIDYFPRAIYEAIGELQTLKTTYPRITLEKRILLVYPFAMYFYFSPKQPHLAKLFARAFQELAAEGKFDSFFYSHPYIRNAIDKVQPEKRLHFKIPNPLLSSESRSLPRSYWFDPERLHSTTRKPLR